MKAIKNTIGIHTIMVLLSASVSLLLFLAIDFTFSSSILREQSRTVLSPEQKPYVERDHGWYELKRDFVGFDRWDNKVYPVKTDHFGFRMDDRQTTAEANQADIIFLGDSFTYGINGRWSDIFVGMLEKKLGRHIVNAGVSSYSPTAYLYQYQRALEAGVLAQPHTVVVALDISDIQDEATRWESGTSHPFLLFDHNVRKPSLSEKIKSRLLFTKRIVEYIRQNREGALEVDVFDISRSAFTWKNWVQLDKKDYPRGYAPLGVAGGIKKCSSQLTKLSQLVKQKRGKLYFLIYPWPAQIKHGNSRMDWELYVDNLCEQFMCAGVINMFPTFRQIAERDSMWYKKYFVEGDIHFSKLGNAVVFNEIAKTIH